MSNSTTLILPAEIIRYIATYLDKDIFVIKLYTAFPEYRNSSFLPVLKNNYNYFKLDYKVAEKLLRYGFRMNIVADYSGLGLLYMTPYIRNIISLKLYISPSVRILRQTLHKFTNLREIIIPRCCIDFNLKKLPLTLQVYKYYDRNGIINIEKYRKHGIKCVNYCLSNNL